MIKLKADYIFLNMALLEVKNISKKLDGDFSVKEISFKQETFQKFAIAGESGAGKSSLLKMISGNLQVDEGEVKFDGEKVLGPNEKLYPGHKDIAYLSQQYEIPNHYRVEEFIWFRNNIAAHEATKLFEICRINHLLKRTTNKLSGGERQRIALCMLLVKLPKMLVLDEPFSNLDPIHTAILKDVLNDVTERMQITCMLSSHDPHDTLSWADEILVMKLGKIVQQGRPEIIYHNPLNEYVAGLFGKYNLLKPAQSALFGIEAKGKTVMLRPEEFNINKTSDGAKGIIQKMSFWGNFYEAEVLVEDVKIKVRMMKNEWKAGEEVWVSLYK